MRQHISDFLDWCEEVDITVLELVQGRKHYKARLDREGDVLLYVLPASPSDRRAMRNAKADIRRHYGIRDNVVATRRKTPYRRKVTILRGPPKKITLSQDPFEVLKKHRDYDRVLHLRLDRAWRRFWRTCMLQATGERSLL